MTYWILQGRLDDQIHAYHSPAGIPKNMDCWRIRRYADEVSFGNLAFIWYPNPGRGIYNISKIVSVPPHSANYENQIRIIWESFRGYMDTDKFNRLSQYQAILSEDQSSDDLYPPLLIDELNREGFGDLPVIEMPRQGIYRLDSAVGGRLLNYLQRTRGMGEREIE